MSVSPEPKAKRCNRVSYRCGFDIGGTFTDFVLADIHSGRLLTYKVLTTPEDLSEAVLQGWKTLLGEMEGSADQVEAAVHATTLITNLLIERRGARTALITTEGFRDVLELRREMRYDIYDLLMTLPPPLIPRPLRLEVKERLGARGEVIVPLDFDSLRSVKPLLESAKIESVAICFLHSYKNAQHEQRTAEWLRTNLPHVRVSLSSEVAPVIREFERTSTTVCNAVAQPVVAEYLTRLRSRLQDAGFERELYLMVSSGGTATVDTAIRFPIRLVESGPAAGAMAAAFFGEKLKKPEFLAFDMGGTTAKMCLIRDGKPATTRQFEVAREQRFQRGSGFPVQVPSVELIEIGAGGGSIAWIDDLGLLKVGPRSAGADPGPACYGFGGKSPTVTDADLVLGYLNPDYFLGGRMRLDSDEAEQAIDSAIAKPLNLSALDAGHAIFRVVNENMISATRVHLSEHAADPRDLYLMAFGGAGPVHAYSIVRALGMRGYICPPMAGVASAVGLLTAPASFEFVRTFIGRLNREALAPLDEVFDGMKAQGHLLLAGAGVQSPNMHFIPQIDLRHVGQGHEVTIELDNRRLIDIDLDQDLFARFYAEYERLYGHAHRHLGLEITACRLTAAGPRPFIALQEAVSNPGQLHKALKGRRNAYFPDDGGFAQTPLYDRDLLPRDVDIEGPAIVEATDTTIVVPPHARLRVDGLANALVVSDFPSRRGANFRIFADGDDS